MKKQLNSTLLAATLFASAIASAASPDFAFQPNKGTYNRGEWINVSYSVSNMPSNQTWRMRTYWSYEGKQNGRRYTANLAVSNVMKGNASFMSRTRVPLPNSNYHRFKFHIDVVHAGDARIILQSKTTSIGVK